MIAEKVGEPSWIRKIFSRGFDVSDFVRQLIRSEFAKLNYIGDDAKKALGLSFEKGE